MKHGQNGQGSTRFYKFNTFTTGGKEEVIAYKPEYYAVNLIDPEQYVPSRRSYYLKQFATFDIESTSVKPQLGDPYAFMYAWQMCIDGTVVFGSYWEEFMLLLDNIKKHACSPRKKMVIYVHNLSYEFQFLRTLLEWKNVFCRGEHKIMRAEIDGFEFRCSYFLSNESLEKFTEHENAKYRKVKAETFDELNGIEYDYDKYRVPSTPQSEIEMSYRYNDVMGLWESVNNRLKDDTLATIPMTSTGYVRRDCRNALKTEKNHLRKMQKYALDLPLYLLCKEAFRGGDTHANYLSVGEIYEDIDSFDYSSAYIYVMMAYKFPTVFKSVSPESFEFFYKQDYAMLFRLRIYGATMKNLYDMPYIPLAKCRGVKNIVNDNGRILSAEMLEISVTEVDYRIIHDIYKIEREEICDLYISEKKLLPKPIRQNLLHYFEKKTLLKGVEGKEEEYIKSKNKLNANFGMMVTDILQDDIVFENNEFKKVEADKEEKINAHYNSKKLFLSYQWGVWITAYSRERLHTARRLVNYETIYNDTDSIKVPSGWKGVVDNFNEKVMAEIKSLDIIPKAVDKNGKVHYMGLLEYEGTYDKFITWGAKKYATEKNGKIETTVAGLSRKLGAEKLAEDGFEAFKPGWEVNPSGNLTAYYNNDMPHYITEGGESFLTASNVAMFKTHYILDITGEYEKLLKKVDK